MTTEHTSPRSDSVFDSKFEEEEMQDAISYTAKIKSFYIHLLIYFIAIPVLAINNIVRTPDEIWIVWTALVWGMALFGHAMQVFEKFTLFGSDWENRQIKKRLEQKRQLRKRLQELAASTTE